MGCRVVLLLTIPLLGAAFVATDLAASLTGPSIAEAEQKRRPGLFERLFAAPPSQATPPRSSMPRSSSPTKRRVIEAPGSRTLCVRTCDGYYFPISSSASRNRFKIDEAVCKAMYGGAEANLYVHYNGSPADTAVSLSGKRLSAEPHAFAFRETFNPSCQAELKSGLSRLGAAFAARAEAKSTKAGRDLKTVFGPVPDPLPRVVAGTDPETLANRGGSFTVGPVTPPDEEEELATASLLIRKIGAGYYYADPIVIETLSDPPPRGPVFTLIGSARADPRPDRVVDGGAR